MIALTVNGTPRQLDVSPDMPLLWAIREALGLTGTKYGCGMALCGACTVHVDGTPARACVTPVSAVTGKRVTTIEGLSDKTDHPVQRAWMELECSLSLLGASWIEVGLPRVVALITPLPPVGITLLATPRGSSEAPLPPSGPRGPPIAG